MTSAKPPGDVRSTKILVSTVLSHLSSGFSAESVPSTEVYITQVGNTSVIICDRSVGLIKESVAGTFYKRFIT